MKTLDDIRAHLLERFGLLDQYLGETEEESARQFFQQVKAQLVAVEDEADLQMVFFNLSTTAFQPFYLDPMAAVLVDDILAYAENVAHAFSADTGTAH